MTSATGWSKEFLSNGPVSRLTESCHELAGLRDSIGRFGFGQLREALTASQLGTLRDEAATLMESARRAEQAAEPPYRARIAPLGPEATEFLSSPETRSLLYSIFGREYCLSPQRSTLTFYEEGDHLGPHVDKPEAECAVTVLVYLVAYSADAASREGGTGLTLHVYGDAAPLDTQPVISFPTLSGSLVIGRGSRIWHERPRLAPGERVVGLTGCYADVPIQ